RLLLSHRGFARRRASAYIDRVSRNLDRRLSLPCGSRGAGCGRDGGGGNGQCAARHRARGVLLLFPGFGRASPTRLRRPGISLTDSPLEDVVPAPGTHENRRSETILSAVLCPAIFVGTRIAGTQ